MVRRPRAAVQTAARAIALALIAALPPAAHAGVIPAPLRVELADGEFNVDAAVVLRVPAGDREADASARYLADLWTRTNGLTLPVGADAARAGIRTIEFRRRRGFGGEAYKIEVAPRRILVTASSSAGLFYGAVTLWQLLPAGLAGGDIRAQTITDAPRYSWRGLMLDSSRHFQSPAFVRSMIDWMAWHKLNVLHWHLTDDQGWRLEIRKYPRLTSVGAWRIPASVPGSSSRKPYGGYYTQQQVRSIVAFAATRHVQIIPEIDMPGHAQAALAAYPELGAIDSHPTLPVSPNWGVHSHLFNLEPGTFEFLQNVLDEVMQLFPSRYVHIGGDEAVKDEWNASAGVQARARLLGISDSNALQTYFTQKISGYLSAKGRRAVGWDEILQPGLRADAVVMSWHGASTARAAAVQGNDTVLAPDPMLYLDHRQGPLATEPPGRIAIISLKNVYDFEPYDAELSGAQQQHVLGLQADLWTEHMQTEGRVEWMALPRAAALAEVGWSSPQRSWPDFLKRLVSMSARYRALGLNYADSVFGIDPHFAHAAGGIRVTLANLPELKDAALDSSIRYTLDGQEPSVTSARYAAPLLLAAGTEIRAATYLGSQQASRTWISRLDARTGARRTSHELELCSNGVGLLLEPGGDGSSGHAPLAVDIMNPCWVYRDVDLEHGPQVLAAVAALPFNYELGLDAAKIRVGDNRTREGELEVHVDGCDTATFSVLPLAAATNRDGVTELPATRLPRLPGRHDVCLRFARPRLDPLWALDWVEIEN
ncbi:MAG TPA: family 20 glycosylhydrolase [Steroidobacteraceae bacterium]|nr:family 20 glycosylhydrolase [Steroidobacteraceae bacterium]